MVAVLLLYVLLLNGVIVDIKVRGLVNHGTVSWVHVAGLKMAGLVVGGGSAYHKRVFEIVVLVSTLPSLSLRLDDACLDFLI